MAIIAYVGLPGHGKSYGVVANVILPALRQKRLVYTNIPMNEEHCLNQLGMAPVPFTIDDLLKNPNWFTTVFTSGAVLVLDECWRLWPSGLKASNVREGDKTFLAEHRHMVGENGFSTEIYLVTQDLSQLAMFVRALVESTIRMVKLTNLGLDKRFRVDMYSGCVTGSKPPVSKREREIHGGKFKKEIYDFYKSHTKSETGFAGDETKTDKRFNIFKGFGIKLGLVFIICCAVFIWFGSQTVKNAYAPKPAPKDEKPSQSPKAKTPVGSNKLASSSAPATSQSVEASSVLAVEFLSKAKYLYISYTLGNKPLVRYFYRFVFDNYEVSLNEKDLITMGYSLDPVNECLVKVTGSDFAGYIMCGKSEPPRGLLASVGSEITDAANDSAR